MNFLSQLKAYRKALFDSADLSSLEKLDILIRIDDLFQKLGISSNNNNSENIVKNNNDNNNNNNKEQEIISFSLKGNGKNIATNTGIKIIPTGLYLLKFFAPCELFSLTLCSTSH